MGGKYDDKLVMPDLNVDTELKDKDESLSAFSSEHPAVLLKFRKPLIILAHILT